MRGLDLLSTPNLLCAEFSVTGTETPSYVPDAGFLSASDGIVEESS